jgi:hypothetical protein
MIEATSQPVAQPAGPADYSETRSVYSMVAHLALDILAFLIPILVCIEFDMVGHLYAAEFALFAFVPLWVFRRKTTFFSPILKVVLVLGVVWLLGQIVTDLLQGTPFADYARGWSKIAVTLSSLLGIYFLVGVNRRRILLFAVGLVIGQLLLYYYNPTAYAEDNSWKFGVAIPLTFLAAIVSASWPFNVPALLPTLIMVGMGGVNLVMGDRSVALVSLLTGCYLLAQRYFTRRGDLSGRASFRPRLILLLTIAASGWILSTVYANLAEDGTLGKDAQTKYEMQSAGSYGLFLGGRSEMFVSLQAVSDSPFLGHGSWAKDSHYIDMLYGLRQLGYRTISPGTLRAAYRKGVIPTHSYFFGAWVEGGIAGAFFWGFVFYLVANVLGRICIIREPLSPLIVYTSMLLGWNILFSPYGGDSRIVAAFTLVVLIFAWTVLGRRRRAVPAQVTQVETAPVVYVTGTSPQPSP